MESEARATTTTTEEEEKVSEEAGETSPRVGRRRRRAPDRLVMEPPTRVPRLGSSSRPRGRPARRTARPPSPSSAPALAPAPSSGADSSSDVLSAVKDSVFESLTCGICSCVFHECVSVWPCLHPFCGGCLGKWVFRHHKRTCPHCRAPLDPEKVAPNAHIRALVDTLLTISPGMQTRTGRDLAVLSAANQFRYRARAPGSSTSGNPGANPPGFPIHRAFYILDDHLPGAYFQGVPPAHGPRVNGQPPPAAPPAPDSQGMSSYMWAAYTTAQEAIQMIGRGTGTGTGTGSGQVNGGGVAPSVSHVGSQAAPTSSGASTSGTGIGGPPPPPQVAIPPGPGPASSRRRARPSRAAMLAFPRSMFFMQNINPSGAIPLAILQNEPGFVGLPPLAHRLFMLSSSAAPPPSPSVALSDVIGGPSALPGPSAVPGPSVPPSQDNPGSLPGPSSSS